MEGRTYRYFRGRPLYPFGHGLSYTEFRYSDLTLPGVIHDVSQGLEVGVTVENAGDRAGDEVVQFYVADLTATVPVPIRQLAGFVRVSLAPGATRRVTVTIPPALFEIVSDEGQRIIEPGDFAIIAGGRQPLPGEQPADVVRPHRRGRHVP